MKVRNGFVSNSSSSSFVLIVTKEAFNEAISKESPLGQAILSHVMEKATIFGRDCMTYGDCSSDYHWDDLPKEKILEKAKEIANGGPLLNDGKEYSDDDYLDIINDNVNSYSVKSYFKNVPKDQKWSYSMDW